jgi:hypothetical protein
MRIRWGMLGGQLGIGFILAGFVLIFLGWNGAASYDRAESQLPYVISGAIGGLALILVGVGLLMVQAQRANRAATDAAIADLREAIDRLAQSGGASPRVSGGAGDVMVVAGPSSFHRAGCKLVEGRTGLIPIPLPDAEARGLEACRVCAPA